MVDSSKRRLLVAVSLEAVVDGLSRIRCVRSPASRLASAIEGTMNSHGAMDHEPAGADHRRGGPHPRGDVRMSRTTRNPGGGRVASTMQVALGPDTPERDGVLLAFGQRLRLCRADAGLSQHALASRCFLRHDHVSRLELGRTEPSLTVLLVLAHATGVTVGELTSELPIPNRQASRAEMRALFAGEPGITTTRLAAATGLPIWYVLQNGRYLRAFEEIV